MRVAGCTKGTVHGVIRITRSHHVAAAAVLVVSLLLLAFQRLDAPACYRVRCRVVAARHSGLMRPAAHWGDSYAYRGPLSGLDLAALRDRESAGVVRDILRIHRTAFVPVLTGRLKLPPSHDDPL